MRTITYTKDLYNFDELSNGAKENALNDWQERHDPFCDSEFECLLKEIDKKLNINITNWCIGGYRCDDRIEWKLSPYWYADTVDEINNELRLNRWICNNWENVLSSGKYYSKWDNGNCISRISKTLKKADYCELTGTYTDYSFLKAIHDQITGALHFSTLESLLNYAFDKLASAWASERDYEFSMDFLAEESDANEWEYDENGKRV